MAGTMVSASTGAMNSLLGKLTTLMGEELAMLKGVRKEVASLENEFSSMNALLEKLANMDELDPQAKEWRNQVKDMSYEIEDCIDEFIHRLGKNDATTGFMRKTARFLKKLRARHQIASKIQVIKARVKEASERRNRYKLDEYKPKPRYAPVDPRVVATYAEAAGLVGIDGPREELAKLLMGKEQKLKVASIVGFGGLGKTTLANQVYRKTEGQFECRAFVSVSQKPDMQKLFSKILLEIKGRCFSHTGEVDDLLKNITEHLRDKSYFIVIDDLWNSSAWEIIKCAFPKNNRGSRVLTTTRIYSVANACCPYSKQNIYKMRPLGEKDSRRLFVSRIFGSGKACPDEFEELSTDILKKCGGLPLALTSIASLLACQSKMAWEYVRNSLCFMFEGNPSLEDMKQILDLSYRNLPHHLKTCLLYLGIYPEDYIISKTDLVRQWIAEGFVSKVHGLDAEVVAGCYFNELINMSMIQTVDTDYNDEVLTCRVHDLVLDLIRFRFAEENFIDVMDDPQATTGLHKKTRRVSLQYDGAGDGVIPKTIYGSVSQVRSVVALTRNFLPSFWEFKYVRVLLLAFESDCRHDMDLTSICGLFLLRYLKIVTDGDLALPNKLWGLQYLETMVLEPKRELSIPSDIVRLRRLLHLIVPRGMKMKFQDEIGSLKSLRTLRKFVLSESSLDSIKSLGDLTNLRDLQLSCGNDGLRSEAMDALCYSLERLSHSSSLRSLVTSNDRWDPLFDTDNRLGTLSRFPRHLRRLHLRVLCFPRIPKWVAQLHDLYTLELVVMEVVPNDDDIAIIACLPSLVHLHLEIVNHPIEKIVIPGTGVAFPALKHLQLGCPKPSLSFESGAMPRLQKLELRFPWAGWEHVIKWLELKSVVIEHLPAGMREIHLKCLYKHPDETKESALRSVLNAHHPGIDLSFGW